MHTNTQQPTPSLLLIEKAVSILNQKEQHDGTYDVPLTIPELLQIMRDLEPDSGSPYAGCYNVRSYFADQNRQQNPGAEADLYCDAAVTVTIPADGQVYSSMLQLKLKYAGVEHSFGAENKALQFALDIPDAAAARLLISVSDLGSNGWPDIVLFQNDSADWRQQTPVMHLVLKPMTDAQARLDALFAALKDEAAKTKNADDN